jgi:hypothetical protein
MGLLEFVRIVEKKLERKDSKQDRLPLCAFLARRNKNGKKGSSFIFSWNLA